VVIAIVLVVLLASGGGTGARASKEIHREGDSGPNLGRCVDLWNRPANAAARSSVSALIADFVSVTTSDLYPGKCLITAANSQLNLSAQFLENGAEYQPVASGENTTLPVSVTGWNAASDEKGYILLGD